MRAFFDFSAVWCEIAENLDFIAVCEIIWLILKGPVYSNFFGFITIKSRIY